MLPGSVSPARRTGRSCSCSPSSSRPATRRRRAAGTLNPFAHLGIELPERADVDEAARRGAAAGCLALAAAELPPPVGYICMLRDPDGNLVEFSWDQDLYAKARDIWRS